MTARHPPLVLDCALVTVLVSKLIPDDDAVDEYVKAAHAPPPLVDCTLVNVEPVIMIGADTDEPDLIDTAPPSECDVHPIHFKFCMVIELVPNATLSDA